MNYLDILLRWAHIVGAILLAGGIFYQWFVRPRGADGDDALCENWQERSRPRWAMIVMLATTLLLVSGLVNTANIAMRYKLPTYYHMLLGVKLLAALAVFFLAATLSGRRSLAQRLRQNAGRWLGVLVLLNLLIVCLAGVMKFAERVPK